MMAFFNGCQESLIETNLEKNSIKKLEKSDPKIPDTYVHCVVTWNYYPYNYVVGTKVELWKDGILLDYDYSGMDGAYNICICVLGAGTGYYIVKTEVYVKGQKWACAKSFYWNHVSGPWDFELDLPLALTIEKVPN